jgi:hypothetical protein
MWVGTPWLILADVTHSWRPRNDAGLSAAWSTLAVGLGASAALEPLNLGVRVHVATAVELIGASVELAGRSDQGSRWIAGGRGGLDLHWQAPVGVGVLVGGDLSWTPTTTDVRVQGEVLATIPSTRVLVRVGAFVTF